MSTQGERTAAKLAEAVLMIAIVAEAISPGTRTNRALRALAIRSHVDACDAEEQPAGSCRACGEPWVFHPDSCQETP